MTNVILQRLETSDEGTFGTLTLPDGTSFHCAELPWRNNASGMSCVPSGSYPVILVFSPHFNRHIYQLQQVPGRSDVEIHPGNFAGDTSMGYSSDVEGCILPGMNVGSIPNKTSTQQNPVMQKAVIQSGNAVTIFMQKLNNQNFTIEIRPITQGANP